MQTAMLDSVFKEIEKHVQETGDKSLSVATIADKGWLIGAKYMYVLNLAKQGVLPSTKLVSPKNKNRFSYKIFYKDLMSYLTQINNEGEE